MKLFKSLMICLLAALSFSACDTGSDIQNNTPSSVPTNVTYNVLLGIEPLLTNYYDISAVVLMPNGESKVVEISKTPTKYNDGTQVCELFVDQRTNLLPSSCEVLFEIKRNDKSAAGGRIFSTSYLVSEVVVYDQKGKVWNVNTVPVKFGAEWLEAEQINNYAETFRANVKDIKMSVSADGAITIK